MAAISRTAGCASLSTPSKTAPCSVALLNPPIRYNTSQFQDSSRPNFLIPAAVMRSPISMQTEEVLPKRTVFKVAALILLVFAACFAQESARSAQATPPASAPESAQSYLDPLPQDTGVAGLKQELRRLQNTGRLMMVTAHPDDEDGGVLTLEARGKGVHALLMTLTRGEGGQNELGSGLFDKLGVLRTLEQLASDKYYGVDQRFSRVADFGYSKTPEETFQKWGGH